MAEQTVKFDNITVSKEEFYNFQPPIDLTSVNADQIVISDKFKHNKEDYKHFIGYQKNWNG